MLVKITKEHSFEQPIVRPKFIKGEQSCVDRVMDSIKSDKNEIKRDSDKFRAITDLSARLAAM